MSERITGTNQALWVYTFCETIWVEKLLDCLERNEQKGVVYHREGFHGDYDDFEDVEELIAFILAGEK